MSEDDCGECMVWSMVSKAAERSSTTKATGSLLDNGDAHWSARMMSYMHQQSDVLCTFSLEREVFKTVYELKTDHQFKTESTDKVNPKLWIKFDAASENSVNVTIVQSSGQIVDDASEDTYKDLDECSATSPKLPKLELNDLIQNQDTVSNTAAPLEVDEVLIEDQLSTQTDSGEGAYKEESLHYWSTDTELAEDGNEDFDLKQELEDDHSPKQEKRQHKKRKAKARAKTSDSQGKPKRKYNISKMRGHYTCNHCPFETGFKKNLALHVKENHKGEKGLRNRDKILGCQYCNVKVTDTYGLLRHMKRMHRSLPDFEELVDKIDKERSFPCTYPGCTMTFVRQANVARHILDVHEYDGPGVACEICKKRVKNDKCLKVHMKIVHEIKHKDYLCFLCGSSYKSKGQLDDHLRNVHGARRFPCDSCEFLGKSPKTLRRHQQRSHGPALYMCAFCAKKFRSKNNLDVHVMTIHQAGEIEQHQCPECPRKFNLKCNLKKHVDGVHKKVFLKCNFCHKRFMRPEHRDTHISNKHPQLVEPVYQALEAITPIEAIVIKPPEGDYRLL